MTQEAESEVVGWFPSPYYLYFWFNEMTKCYKGDRLYLDMHGKEWHSVDAIVCSHFRHL